MSFLDKVFRWKKKPFKSAHPSKADQSGKEETERIESRGTGKYADVLLRPHISEKSSASAALNQYVFEVSLRTSKHEVAAAINDLYGILPEAVNIINMLGKRVRFGRTQGETKGWKKAIVTLPKGKSIDVYKK